MHLDSTLRLSCRSSCKCISIHIIVAGIKFTKQCCPATAVQCDITAHSTTLLAIAAHHIYHTACKHGPEVTHVSYAPQVPRAVSTTCLTAAADMLTAAPAWA
jgi:hypothetical protein